MVGRDPGSLRYVVGGALAAPAEIRLAALVRPLDPAPGEVGPTTREGTMKREMGMPGVGGILGCVGVVFVALILLAVKFYQASTEYGPCVGVTEARDSTLRYEVSVPNIIIGVVGAETVILPVYVVLKDFHCPVGTR
jgi:hypothetical protein